jgi:hypothetical protein
MGTGNDELVRSSFDAFLATTEGRVLENRAAALTGAGLPPEPRVA